MAEEGLDPTWGVNGGGMLGHWGVDVQRLCQGNGPAIMSVVAVSSQ